MADEIIKTDLLIIGAGPAGAALANFLASHGKFIVRECQIRIKD
jgi:2-polyprenyl-6-methoxyphenol hydroxylase-like FAD-dependent oxidoreductase